MSETPVEPGRIYPTLRYRDAPAMIAWLCRAFGFAEHVVYPAPDGTIAHAELSLGSAMIMLGSARDDRFGAMVGAPIGPDAEGGNGQAIYIALDDPDGLYARAKAAGARILMDLTDTDYGSREFICRDPEGYVWCFGSYWPKAHEPAR
ncbi:MAG TPA: VOC family protein [Geminicoccaceae bacterium]|nr:VOC family protein [Geminicoccaceae bacterium]